MRRTSYLISFCVFVIVFVVQNECRKERIKNIYGHLMPTPVAPLHVVDRTCLLVPDIGPCRGQIKMHYFNAREMNCQRKFVWGGCQGNGNRFDTAEQCLAQCLSHPNPAKVRPEYCNLSFDYGYCYGAFKRWHYNQRTHSCEQRMFSGCGGNSNNFDSKELCNSVCLFRTGPIDVPWYKKAEV